MKLTLPPLPYAMDALEPHLSRRTLEFHYEKHHRGYLAKLERALSGTVDGAKGLEELVRHHSSAVSDNAAQVWNHTFYWNSMTPG
nr:superoxide dismutase [Fe] [Myxococcota bacterium]